MAISLPSVVGEAVWPCVRASMATSACSSARPATASMTCARAAARTPALARTREGRTRGWRVQDRLATHARRHGRA